MIAPLCNMCGLTTALGDEGHPCHGPHGLIDAQVTGGYESTPGNGSGALDDMTQHRFSLCEFCLDWLFSQFKVPVSVHDPMDDYRIEPDETIEEARKRLNDPGIIALGPKYVPLAWKPAAQRVAEDDWRKMKSEFQAEHDRRAAARGR